MPSPARSGPLTIAPCSRAEANAFVDLYHRHCKPVDRCDLFRVALIDHRGGARGVAIATRPVAPKKADGCTIEIARVAVHATENACSRLYATICAAAAALGYWRAITYTLESEPGTSPKAAGFEFDGWTEDRDWLNAHGRSDEGLLPGFERERTTPKGPKRRWICYLNGKRNHYLNLQPETAHDHEDQARERIEGAKGRRR